jgi:hypothetical protein
MTDSWPDTTSPELKVRSVIPSVLSAVGALLFLDGVFRGEGFVATIFSLLATGLGIFGAAMFFETSSVRLDTGSQTLTFSWRGFWQATVPGRMPSLRELLKFKSTTLEIPLAGLQGVLVEYEYLNSMTLRSLTLVTSSGRVPVGRAFRTASAGHNYGRHVHQWLLQKGLALTYEECQVSHRMF